MKLFHLCACVLVLEIVHVSGITQSNGREYSSYSQQPQYFQGIHPSYPGFPSPSQIKFSPRKQKMPRRSEEQLQNLQKDYDNTNYDFKYHVHGGDNFFGHEESRRGYKARGQYHLLLPDGRRQIVTYYADETGFHPTITYELVNLSSPPQNELTNDGYNRPKRSRYFKHGKKVNAELDNLPMFFNVIR